MAYKGGRSRGKKREPGRAGRNARCSEGGPPGRNRMTERAREVPLEGMIVKTGLQDAAKNVRIYGTISAASSPSARPLHRGRASRITLPCPLVAFSPPPKSSSLYVPLSPPFRGAHVGSYFLSLSSCCESLRVSPPFPPLHVLYVIPTRSPHFVRGVEGGGGEGPTTVGRAQRGAIAPTAAGTTLMLH